MTQRSSTALKFEEHIGRISALHDAEVAQRHKPITWWRERYGDDWVAASTRARRELDAAIYQARADQLDAYVESLPDGVTTEAGAEAHLLRRRAEDLLGY